MESRPQMGFSYSLVIRKMKTISVITYLVLLSISNLAAACSCQKLSLEETYENSSEVFIGHILEAKEVPSGTDILKNNVVAKYNIVEVFKGKPKNGGEIIDSIFTGGSCSVGTLPGVNYLIFKGTSDYVSVCNGTKYYNVSRDAEVINKLRKMRD